MNPTNPKVDFYFNKAGKGPQQNRLPLYTFDTRSGGIVSFTSSDGSWKALCR